MQDLIGRTLGHYRIVDKIGEGGMGEVYRAHDERLDRDVAIKVLPEDLAEDPQLLARFEREAKLLASLSHQNIATLYGLEEHEDRRFLVMELAEGETLAERIKRGPIPVDDALDYARQIAEGLESAHENGIIHRDLKPANVMVSSDGKVKVLDFGLAKAWHPDESDVDIIYSRTLTGQMTGAGVLLGTAAYMSPEQARGKAVDKRADIWAFGGCLYEMLTGKPLFTGDSVTDVLASVLTREPDIDALPAACPPSARRLLERTIEKNPKRRLRDIGDAGLEIEASQLELARGPMAPETAPAPRSLHLTLAAATAVVVLGAALVGGWALRAWLRNGGGTENFTKKFIVQLPEGVTFRADEVPDMAVSRDGRCVVFSSQEGVLRSLFRRQLGRLEIEKLPGTEDASYPFFSPDGRAVAYFAGNKLKRLDLDGGRPVDLCETAQGAGGSWGIDGTIVFNSGWVASGLFQVPASGGTPRPLTELREGETGHWWPDVLPDGEHVLYTIWRTSLAEDIRVAVTSRVTGETKEILRGASFARYHPSGHLFYGRAGRLMAVRFDLNSLTLKGRAVPIVEDVNLTHGEASAPFAVSQTGVLVYRPGGVWSARRRIVWVDRQGRVTPVGIEAEAFMSATLSPDGERVALAVFKNGRTNLHVHNLASGTTTQLTFDDLNLSPIWSPDGREVVFTTARNGPYDVYRVPVDRSSDQEPVATGPEDHFAQSWSSDGSVILMRVSSADMFSVQAVSPDGRDPPFEVHLGRGRIDDPTFSPDGRWVAFVSGASGREQVYIVRYPDPSGIAQISTAGGRRPLWSPRGDELFFISGPAVMAVDVGVEGGELKTGKPHRLFKAPFYDHSRKAWSYDTRNDRFLMIELSDQEMWTDRFVVVTDWFEELERLLPAEE